MTFSWRHLTAADVPALTALSNVVTQAEGTGRPVTEDLVAEEFEAPRFDPVRDTASAWQDGVLIAAGSVWSGAEPVEGRALVVVNGDVHPDRRGLGLGTELLRRLERRAVALAAERFPGHPVRLRSPGGTENSATQHLLESFGYRPDNYFITMEVELATWQDPGLPTTAVPLDAPLLEATRDAHNDAFRDHRNFSPIPADLWRFWTGSAASRPALGRVVHEDGRVLAYALVSESQPGVAHVELVGTRRQARGRGLAREVLLGTLRAAQNAGLTVSELEVDSTSPTGADRLYTSAGYRGVRTISRYQRDVGADVHTGDTARH